MSDTKRARTDPEAQFWDQLDGHTAGMLGVTGSGQHLQPMTHFTSRDEKALYFFSSRSSDLVAAITPGATALYTYVAKDHDYHACMKGKLSISNDPALIEKFWSPIVGAWFADGKSDPDLALLRLELEDAAIWASTDSTLKFGWEIAKANVTDSSDPDVGVSNHIWFRQVA
ncbi:MAG: pyridoxamine 5'-phosphate oxidase family protein [Pacificimonas sp.]